MTFKYRFEDITDFEAKRDRVAEVVLSTISKDQFDINLVSRISGVHDKRATQIIVAHLLSDSDFRNTLYERGFDPDQYKVTDEKSTPHTTIWR